MAAESQAVQGQRWLAVSSSGTTLSVALAVGTQRYVAEMAPSRGSPRQITPLVDAVLHQARLTLADVDVWVVDTGPGTFTGLRQGLALLRGFAFALQKPLFGVSALDALLAQSEQPTALVVLPARTDTWYVGLRHQGQVTQVCLTEAELTNWWSAQQIAAQTQLGVVGPTVLPSPWQSLLAPYPLVPLVTTLTAAHCLDVAQMALIPLAGPDPLLVVPHYLLASEPEQARGEIPQVVLPADQRVPLRLSPT